MQVSTGAVAAANAALNEAQVNMGFTTIVSPIDGFVLTRAVDVGQTVAASLSAPVLFTIAQDLKNIQVDTYVSEADVGKLQPGMNATFTVDAYPGKPFKDQAVAYWTSNEDEATHLVNRQGEVFVAGSNANLPAFSGPQRSAPYLLRRFGVFDEGLGVLGRRVVGVRLSPREAWQLELDDGMVLVLGRDQEKAPLQERLARFIRGWPKTLEQVGVQVAVVDLRYQGGFALTPEPPTPEAKAKQ